MSYSFQGLPQLVDKREGLAEKGEYSKRVRKITHRVWHHSLTRKHLGGSDAASFASYHVGALGWPGCGYAFVIEPKNVIDTPNGKRARIVWVHDIDRRTYHVGNSNQFALGICVAGDYRYDDLDEATKASIDELHDSLVRDGIGDVDKSHNEMPGYSWKACCVFDYKKTFTFLDGQKPAPVPDVYTIQEGDTLWGIANNMEGISVEDLIAANPGVDPRSLSVGQKINLGKAKNAYTRKPEEPKKPQSTYKYPLSDKTLRRGDQGEEVRQMQNALAAVYFYPDKGAPNNGVDGAYGPKTEDAVKRFQKVYTPHAVDGVFGPNTRSKLKALLKSKGY